MKQLIRVEGLKKSFYTPAGELPVLRGVDAVFNEGEMISIIGVSGVGKSTLLHIIGTLDKPTSGTVSYNFGSEKSLQWTDPFSLNNGSLAAFRNNVIGFIFQFHYLLPEFSAIENVMMPGLISNRPKNHLYKRAEELLKDLGLQSRIDHKPGELSGGEQQRVAVARSLILEPKVVLADEPTGNLDTATGEELFSLLTEINQKRGVTFIIVTHNENLSKKCHRIMEMSEGKLLAAS